MGVRETRIKVITRLTGVLGDATMAKRLEKAVYNCMISTCEAKKIPRYWENMRCRDVYVHKALSMVFNLSNPKNPELLKQVQAGDIAVEKLVTMTPQQLFPTLYEPVYARIAERQLRRETALLSWKDASDGIYTCGKCKSKKTHYVCLQTRAADEPMTEYVTCLKCGNRWKS